MVSRDGGRPGRCKPVNPLFHMCKKRILPWIALQAVPSLGLRKKIRLLERYESPDRIFSLTRSELESEKLNEAAIRAIMDGSARGAASRIYEKAGALGVQILSGRDSGYPRLLKEIYNPPQVIYVYGDVGIFSGIAVAVIGSRRPSAYGRQMTARLAAGLTRGGVIVVSGMARGLDSLAHRTVLDAGGVTAAVLGSGFACPYPAENKGLMKCIMKKGCVISEYPPDTPPLQKNFPERNRIISGLSSAVVVVEASEKSGSLITASLALEQGREVFAVAGNVTSSLSRGTNRLIKSGAVPVETAADVLAEVLPAGFFMEKDETVLEDDLTDGEKSIINYLADNGECQINEISGHLGRPVEETLHYLLCLELKKMVRQRPGQNFEMRVI